MIPYFLFLLFLFEKRAIGHAGEDDAAALRPIRACAEGRLPPVDGEGVEIGDGRAVGTVAAPVFHNRLLSH